jgi:hypothetical protein
LKELREKKKLLKNKYTKVACCCSGEKKAARAMQSVMEARPTFLMLIKESGAGSGNFLTNCCHHHRALRGDQEGVEAKDAPHTLSC